MRRPATTFVALWLLATPLAAKADETPGTTITPGLDVIALYASQWFAPSGDTTWFHTIDVPRVHASLTASRGPVRARALLEAVRSTSDGALLGVGGDSLLVRFREASAGFDHGGLHLDAGLVPTTSIPVLEAAWRLRGVSMTALEHSGLAFPADLGVKVRWELPGDHGTVQLGVFDGEGYARREVNRGKTTAGSILLRPFSEGSLGAIRLFAFGEYGSSGVGRTRAHRAGAAAWWDGDALGAGAGWTEAWGLFDDGARRGRLLFAFVRAEPLQDWLAGLQVAHEARDLDNNRNVVTDLVASVGRRLYAGLELHAMVERRLADASAGQADPLADLLETRVALRCTL